MGGTSIGGTCDERFAKVREVFESSFDSGEVGAGACVVIDGETVVDLWGGWADGARTRPWQRDTIVNVWSTTKGMTAVCAHRLIDDGRLDLDEPVATYWPEFAQNGKDRIPVRYVLSHRAGLPWVQAPPTDWDATCAALAAAAPAWEPGTKHGYHALTFGHLAGELVRRIDGRSLGTFFREEVAQPLGADFMIGFGESHDGRVAEMLPAPPPPESAQGPAARVGRGAGNMAAGVNTREWRAAEIPAGNGHGTAAAVARVYAALARGGEIDGVRVLSADGVERANTEQCRGEDQTLKPLQTRFGLGFMMTAPMIPFGPNPRSFGHPGAGGSTAFADPDAKLGFGYVMNQMQQALTGGAHGYALINAVYECL